MATFLTGAIVRQDHNTTRRSLLRGSAAVAVAGTVAAVPVLTAEPEDDAELLAARVRIVGAAEEINRFNAEEGTAELPFDHPLVLQEEAALIISARSMFSGTL